MGTVPSEHSSGDSVVHVRITKASNSHCRSALVEGVAATCGLKQLAFSAEVSGVGLASIAAMMGA